MLNKSLRYYYISYVCS